jgi:hypothetical protein
MKLSQYRMRVLPSQTNSLNQLCLGPLRFAIFFIVCLITVVCAKAQSEQTADFAVRPYLQLGDNAHVSQAESLSLIWLTASDTDKWQLLVKRKGASAWNAEKAPECTSVFTPQKLFRFQANLTNLPSGAPFQYRLLKNNKEVCQADGQARKGSKQSCRFVLFGDMGANTDGQRKIAYQVFQKKPDALILLGDIVYDLGRFSEYLEKFFPIYNAQKSSPLLGAPLLQSTVSVACIGNHDVALGDYKNGINLDKYPDGFAYFNVWSQPLNGPLADRQGASVPKVSGSQESLLHFLAAASEKYPRMANYSFDYGSAHFLVLDANPYMDWTNATLRNWVISDLDSAKQAKWKIVCFHQPGFSSDVSHYKEQRMRLMAALFEKAGVDIVFCGHAHNYQRSYPLTFKIKMEKGQPVINQDGTIDGDIQLDKIFDGIKNESPKGVPYIVSGAGGAKLYPSAKDSMPWLNFEFTDKFIGDTHSFTMCDIAPSQMSISQISENGNVLDHFTIKKDKQNKEEKPSQGAFASSGSTRSAK